MTRMGISTKEDTRKRKCNNLWINEWSFQYFYYPNFTYLFSFYNTKKYRLIKKIKFINNKNILINSVTKLIEW